MLLLPNWGEGGEARASTTKDTQALTLAVDAKDLSVGLYTGALRFVWNLGGREAPVVVPFSLEVGRPL
jgi:hypothetical protein